MKYIFPDKILKIFEGGRLAAERLKHSAIAPEHIIIGIATDQHNRARTFLNHFGVKIDIVEMRAVFCLNNRYANESEPGPDKTIVITLVSNNATMPTRDYRVTTEMLRIMRVAELESRMLHCDEVRPEHFILAMLREDSTLKQIMDMYKVNYSVFKSYIEDTVNAFPTHDDDQEAQSSASQHSGKGSIIDDLIPPPMSPQELEDERLNNRPERDEEEFDDDRDDDRDEDDDEDPNDLFTSDRSTKSQRVSTAAKGTDTPTLDKFGYDLTTAAEQGLLDPVVGREEEIEHTEQALLRRKKNNPVLIGEPGVGKTAVVEGLALRIARHQVCWALQNKRIVVLDLPALVAGTKFRGMFEKRLTKIVAELRNNKDIIVFIDEIHTLVGAGGASGTMDAANILKPALSRGEFQCIGATSFDEYRNSIEKDGALERRFQKVTINPTSAADTLVILQNLRDRYEQHHHVRYTDEALEMCVRLTDRYVTDRNFPDKAIDALDEAGARAHVKENSYPELLLQLERKLKEAIAMKKKSIEQQDYGDAAMYRDSQRTLESQIKTAREEWLKQMGDMPASVIDAADVARVVASITGVPVEKAAASESDRLLTLRDDIGRDIIGQQEAVGKIVRAIQRSRIGLNDPRRPLGSFLFVGPTGVGKTLLARTLAREVFLNERSFIRLDMSEYAEQHAVARMFGAPPGYLGYDKGGQLAEEVRRHPYSVVLFDELEKAHPNIYNVLLQILDEGRMTDSQGRVIDFRNTIIIMTSNVGSRKLQDFGTGIGFATRQGQQLEEQAEDLIMKEIRRTFAPEFLNRVDDVILFRHLDRTDIRRIVDLELDKVVKRIVGLGYDIEVSEAVRDYLAEHGYDRNLGARPLRRAIQRCIEDQLCDTLLQINRSSSSKSGYHICVGLPESTEADAQPKPVVNVEYRCADGELPPAPLK